MKCLLGNCRFIFLFTARSPAGSKVFDRFLYKFLNIYNYLSVFICYGGKG